MGHDPTAGPTGAIVPGLEQTWIEIPQEGVLAGRGLGMLDLARAVREDRPHLATGELAYHVLDTLASIEKSTERGSSVTVESTVGTLSELPSTFDPFARTV